MNTSTATDAASPSGSPRLFVCSARNHYLRILINLEICVIVVLVVYILVNLVIYDVYW